MCLAPFLYNVGGYHPRQYPQPGVELPLRFRRPAFGSGVFLTL